MKASFLIATLTFTAIFAEGQSFTFVTNKGAITITGYTGTSAAVTVPDTINGLPVTSIYDRTFQSCQSMYAVSIPGTITNVGAMAFNLCINLTNLTLPDSVASVGNSAFSYCARLSTAVLGSNVTSLPDQVFAHCTQLSAFNVPPYVTNIGTNAFVNCSWLRGISLPNSVVFIRSNAFNSCNSISSVVIPDSVRRIEVNAFAGCNNMTNLVLGAGVTNIGIASFSGCSSLTAVTIPQQLTSVGPLAFQSCAGLKTITVDPLNPSYSSVEGILFDKSQHALLECPGGKSGSFIVPVSVTLIGDNAFWFCSGMSGLYFQSSPPALGLVPFSACGVTIYYLPGTTGWGSTYGGRPTALWRPLARTDGMRDAFQTNHFGFIVSWAAGMTVVVDASATLASPAWTPIATNTLATSSMFFDDADWTNFSSRVYRIRWQ